MKYVYKIVCAILAVVVISIVFFSPIIGVRLYSQTASLIFSIAVQNGDEDMVEKYIENNGEIPEHISETTSLYDIAFGDTNTFLSGFLRYFDVENNEELKVLVAPTIAFGVAIVAVVLCALAVIVFGLFSKNNRRVIYSCIAGIGSSLLAFECFEVIEDMFVSGRITLETITQEWWMGMLGDIVNFELLEPMTAIPIIFAVVIVWTLIYNYTLTPEQKRERKLMLGEAD